MAISSISRAASTLARSAASQRWLHSTSARRAITNMEMPAMSPTMNEGGISSWKKKEGESFIAGDVLLEIETDKAIIDVEAQEDGVMGKIIVPDGAKNIPVGQLIALLAEEGDDISNLEIPKLKPAVAKPDETPKSEATPPPPSPSPVPPHPAKYIEYSRPLFPSVSRLLQEHDIPDLEKIKGTGVRGMLTKGDVLAYLGKASSPTGTFKEAQKTAEAPRKVEAEPLDGGAIRRLIVGNFYQSSVKARASAAPKLSADFDSIISDYLPSSTLPSSRRAESQKHQSTSASFLDGLI